MVEVSPMEQYAASDPRTLFFKIPALISAVPGQVQFFETGGAAVWRIRTVQVFGDVDAPGPGSVTPTLSALFSADSPRTWPSNGGLVAASPTDIPQGASFSVTWSLDIADNYAGISDGFGTTINLGLPHFFFPEGVILNFDFEAVGGYIGNVNIQGGLLQIEKFPLGVLVGGGSGQGGNVYLLPQTI